MPPQGGGAPAPAQGQPPAQAQPPQSGGGGGGVSQLVAGIHSGLMKLLDLIQAKFPDDAKNLTGIIQQYQNFIDDLGKPEAGGGGAPGKPGSGNVPVEAGAAQVKPVM